MGGGPAGSAAALHLARAGVSVVVIDKSPPPRYKTCGGGLVLRARRWAGVDLRPVAEREFLDAEVRLHRSPGKGSDDIVSETLVRVRGSEPILTLTMRAELDRHLFDAAVAAGASRVTPCRPLAIVEPSRSGGHGRLRTDRGDFETRFVVAADGAGGPTARLAGWPPLRDGTPALESEIRVGPDDFARLAASARFDFGLVPRGYAWVFPKKDHLSVGCLSRHATGGELKRGLDAYLDRLGIDRVIERQDHGFAIPARPRSRRLAHGRVLLTGDAAGLADPVTYEGISYAILSGRLAARSIVQGRGTSFDRPKTVARAYQRVLEREILSELRLGRALAWILYERPRLRHLLFRRAGTALGRALARVFAGQDDYRSLLTQPTNYARLVARLCRPPAS